MCMYEDDLEDEKTRECEYCGCELDTINEKHVLNCPCNDSPYALLIRDGYD